VTAHSPNRLGSVSILGTLDLERSKPLRKRVDRFGASPYPSRCIGYRCALRFASTRAICYKKCG
jgi:hypothetical protein